MVCYDSVKTNQVTSDVWPMKGNFSGQIMSISKLKICQNISIRTQKLQPYRSKSDSIYIHRT